MKKENLIKAIQIAASHGLPENFYGMTNTAQCEECEGLFWVNHVTRENTVGNPSPCPMCRPLMAWRQSRSECNRSLAMLEEITKLCKDVIEDGTDEEWAVIEKAEETLKELARHPASIKA